MKKKKERKIENKPAKRNKTKPLAVLSAISLSLNRVRGNDILDLFLLFLQQAEFVAINSTRIPKSL